MFSVKVKNPRAALAMPEAALVSLESFPGAVPGLETLQGGMLQPWLM